MLILIALGVLLTIAYIAHIVASKAETVVESSSNEPFHKLQRQFFVVYFLATFSDWLQGAYIYQVYSNYGYNGSQIALLYVTGFFSSMICGIAVGILADKFGRRRLCIAYSFLYAISCLTKASGNYAILIIGRILGGICTSILFSTFEAWYVHQHVQKFHLPPQWINITLAKATFYNGVLAICAGVVSNITAEWAELGPVSPFILSIPFLLLSAVLTICMWEENDMKSINSVSNTCASLKAIFRTRNSPLLQLGFIQSLFESVMYTFVFLWTPVLEPLRPPLGIVFSCFMLCIMIGSSIYSFLVARNYTAEQLLKMSVILALTSFILSAVAMKMVSVLPQNTGEYTQCAFVSFLLYEISVGMYFPAVGYLKSQIIPEQHRASIANWYRVPMNIFTCLSLVWLRNIVHISKEFAYDTAVSSLKAFITCIVLLIAAAILCKILKRESENEKLIVDPI
ncbi:molybdate-anion transporter-like [Periplaneta americana]|uniref:molybdate-anion transporter-like n=1 Tax=Periplaneta americana TaxID=6978 RepID=UPI0037E91FD1